MRWFIIEGFFVAVFKHSPEVFAVVVGAGHGTVDVGTDDDQIVFPEEKLCGDDRFKKCRKPSRKTFIVYVPFYG